MTTAVIVGDPKPQTPAELEEVLSDAVRYQKLLQDPVRFKQFVNDYVGMQRNNTAAALRDAVKQGMDAFAQGAEGKGIKRLPMTTERPVGLGNGFNPSNYVLGANTLGLSRAVQRQVAAYGMGPGAALNGKFPSMQDFIVKAWAALSNSPAAQKLLTPDVVKAMGEASGGEGGFLVPEEFRAELLAMSLEDSVVRPRARVIPMGTNRVVMPAIRDASHATSVYGGIQGSWVAEAADLSTNRQPTFSQVALDVRKLTTYTIISNELMQDSPISIEAIVAALFPAAIAYFEDDAFINGTGAGQPLGIINADALVSVAKETGQAAATILYENLVKMFARMLPSSINRAVWVMHPDTFPQIATMSLAVGTGGSAVWMTNAVGGAPSTILGRPIILSEKCQTLGTAGDIYFVDFGYYFIGDRMGLEVSRSEHVRFTTNEMVWRFIQRVDGRPWLVTALTPRYGTNTFSPYINLATRA